MNGKVENVFKQEVEYEDAMSAEISAGVEASIKTNVIFAESTLSASISASLANEWSSARTHGIESTVSCDTYDDGTAFTGGCMWETGMTTHDNRKNMGLTWNTGIVKCTNSDDPPSCPPFTRCTDKECTRCESTWH